MSASERRKGARGQLAVRRLFEAHGWAMTATASTRRGEAGTCDFLATRAGVTLAVEVKNQAVLRLPLWRRQTLAQAPGGTVPVLVYRFAGAWDATWHTPGRGWLTVPAAMFAETYLAAFGPVAA